MRRTCVAVALGLALPSPPVVAHPSPFTTLSIERGLPQSQVSALVVDPGGALWVGTLGGGLARFDGTAFEVHTTAEGLSDNRVTALAQDPEGRLWIGTEHGLSIRDEEGLRALGPATSPAVVVRALLATRRGEMWVGTGLGLRRYDRRTLAPLPALEGLDGSEITALVEDRKGRVWIGAATRGVARLEAGRLSAFEPAAPGSRVRALLQARDGRVFVGTDAGLFVHDGERLSAHPLPLPGPQPVVHALLEDPSGALWLGTEGAGLGRYRDGAVVWFTEEDGLGASTVWALALDLEGAVWAGTYRGGLSVFRDLEPLPPAVDGALEGVVIRGILEDVTGRLWFATDDRGVATFDGSRLRWLRQRDGLSHDFVLTVFEDRHGTLWFGTLGGLTRYDGRSFRRFGVETGLPGSVVRSVVEDREGAIWVGTNAGAARLEGDAFRSVRTSDERGEDAVNTLYVDDAGRLWAGTATGLFLLDGDRFRSVSLPLSLPGGSVYSIRQQPESGDLWVGLYGRGLARIPRAALARPEAPSSPGPQLLTSRDIPGVDRVVSLAFDPTGDLWMGTELGIEVLHLQRLDPSGRPALSHWGSPLGPERIECVHNASLADRWGRVWVGTLTGPLLFDPRRPSDVPAPLHVSLTAAGPEPGDRTWMPRVRGPAGSPLPRLELGSDDNRAAFSFEAINLSAPSRVRYQFKLEGYESDWSPVTMADQAYYPKLPPGDFEFRVRATRDGRAWFEVPRTFRLRVEAPLWRRGWFQGVGLLAVALLLFGGHRTVVARLRAHQRELQAEVRERERAEHGLRESETRFRTLAETSVSAIFTYGEDDRFSYVNPALEKITGYTAGELMGRRFWDMLPPESQAAVEARRAARERGEPQAGRYELAFLNRAGEERWLDLGIGFVEREGGRTGVATAFDITERRRAEEALRERARLEAFAADVATALTRTGPLREMLQRCCEAMTEHLDAALGRIWTLGEGGDVLELEASAGLSTRTDGAHARVPLGRLNIGLIAEERRPHLTNTVAGDPRVPDQDWVRREGLVSFAGRPLVVEERVVGVIAMFARRALAEATQQALESAAKVIASAIERKRAEEARVRSERRFRALIEMSSDFVSVLDPGGRILYASPSTARVLGFPPEELLQKSLYGLVHSEDRAHARSLVKELLEERGRSVTGEVRLRDASAQWRWLGVTGRNLLDEPAVEGLVLNCRDTTAQKRAEAQLQHDALHDALTGLPNRALLVERLERAATRSRRYPSRRFAVLYLDLDGFKLVNDSLGHETGDQLLVGLAPRIEGCLRSSDTCARLGGDEFVVLLDEVADVGGAVDVAERIQRQAGAPFSIDGHEVRVSASIGIVIGGGDYQRADDILRDADIAMYRAKARGRSRHEIFDVEMRQAAVVRLALENALRQAVDLQRLLVFYQPIVSLASGRLAGFEALVRWQDPERGLVLPGEFVPVAEQGPLIVSIDRWVLREACRQLRAWRESLPGARALTMNVNVSSRHFADPHLAREIRSVLGEFELEPSSLQLEIGESTIMDEVPVATTVLAELRGLGVQVAIDDFGTGHSSLADLVRLPVDTLKIDRTFVERLDGERGLGEIAGTIVALAHSLGMSVIAEGVETLPQRARLRDLGCERAQGHLISQPLGADAVAGWVAAGRGSGL